MNDQKLLPCPFCNEKPIKHWDDSYAVCETIGCPIKGIRMPIPKWNTRHSEPVEGDMEDHDAEISALAYARCVKMWRERIRERINILEFDIEQMKPQLNTMGNIEVTKMINSALHRMNELKSLLSGPTPTTKHGEVKQCTFYPCVNNIVRDCNHETCGDYQPIKPTLTPNLDTLTPTTDADGWIEEQKKRLKRMLDMNPNKPKE
jgi:hypothetical protein